MKNVRRNNPQIAEELEIKKENLISSVEQQLKKYIGLMPSYGRNIATFIVQQRKELSILVVAGILIASIVPLNTFMHSEKAWKALSEVGCEQEALDQFEALAMRSDRYIDTAYDVLQGCDYSTYSLTYDLQEADINTNRVRYEKAMDEWEDAGDYLYIRKDLAVEFRALGYTQESSAVQSEISELKRISRLEEESDVKLWDDVLKPQSLIDFIPIPQAKLKTVGKGIKRFNRANRSRKAMQAAKRSFSAYSRQRKIKRARKLKRQEQIADYKRCLKDTTERACRKAFITRVR